jgi:hypothetical protein
MAGQGRGVNRSGLSPTVPASHSTVPAPHPTARGDGRARWPATRSRASGRHSAGGDRAGPERWPGCHRGSGFGDGRAGRGGGLAAIAGWGCGDGVAVLREPRRGAVRPVGAAQAAGVALGAATRHTRVAMPLPVPLVSAGQPAARASRLGEPTRRFGRRSGPDRAETRHPDSGRGHLRGNGQGHLRDLVAAPQVGASGLSSAQRARCRGGDAGRPRAWCRRRRSGRRTWCSAARPDARACVVFRRRT